MEKKDHTDPEAARLLEVAAELVEEAEVLLDEVIDLELHSKTGTRAPRAKGYKFKVNDEVIIWPKPVVTAREALTKANLTPPDTYNVRLKVVGQKPEPIGLDVPVDLRRPGVEKFRAIKKGQGEGEDLGRRDAPILDQDRNFLDNYADRWEVVVDGSTWTLIPNFKLPAGYTAAEVMLAIRMEGGYPLSQLDMFYVHPAIRRLDGKHIRQADVIQHIDGRDFQRWSRHRTEANPWMAGKDSLETHIYLVEDALTEELLK